MDKCKDQIFLHLFFSIDTDRGGSRLKQCPAYSVMMNRRDF
jgi:hypothetical protein